MDSLSENDLWLIAKLSSKARWGRAGRVIWRQSASGVDLIVSNEKVLVMLLPKFLKDRGSLSSLYVTRLELVHSESIKESERGSPGDKLNRTA